MSNIRCALSIHSWRYGIGPSSDHVVRSCRRCLKITVVAAEPATDQLQRIDDIQADKHPFDARGWPR
jgi:hypothetical protein